MKTARAAALIGALDRQLVDGAKQAGREAAPAVRRAGFNRKTEYRAHPIVALDFAEVLSPNFSIEVKKHFLRARRGVFVAIDQLIDRLHAEIDTLDERVTVRNKLAKENKRLRGEVMAVGVTTTEGCKLGHGTHYRGLYEMSLAALKRFKRLSPGCGLPDYMATPETVLNVIARLSKARAVKFATSR